MNHEHKKFVFFIDKQKFETTESHLTVRQILTDFAKCDITENILVVKNGDQLDELRDLDQLVELKEGMKFTLFSNKPVPVS